MSLGEAILINAVFLRRALGTPLPWPEAKDKAKQVREWGIEVGSRTLKPSVSIRAERTCSNSWPFGAGRRAKRVMRFSGVTRFVCCQNEYVPVGFLTLRRLSTWLCRLMTTNKRSACLCAKQKSSNLWQKTKNRGSQKATPKE